MEVREFLAGGVSGVCGVLFSQPLDLLKVRSQNGAERQAIGQITRKEGMRSLWKGASYPVYTAALQNALVFHSYSQVKRHSKDTSTFTAGAIAGLVQSFVSAPVELIKIRVQVQLAKPSSREFVAPKKMLSKIAVSQGVRGLFTGLYATILRDVPSFGVYFGLYEWCRDFSNPLIAGGIAGAAAWASIYPIDVIKTCIQSSQSKRTFVEASGQIMRERGISGFHAGLGSCLLRAFALNGVVFYVYEGAMHSMDDFL